MIKQEAEVDPWPVRQKFGLAQGTKIINLKRKVHGTGDDKVAADERVDDHKALFVIPCVVNRSPR